MMEHFEPLLMDLEAEIARWREGMLERGVQPYEARVPDLEEDALARLDASVRELEMADVRWDKPKTNASVGIAEYARGPRRNTSKLSPFLALGVLSPRVAFLQWMGPDAAVQERNAARPSSAIAQLMWRETFHAASQHPLFWQERPRDRPLPRTERFWLHELTEGRVGGGWEAWRPSEWDAAAALGRWRNGDVEPTDLRESLQLLAVQGWVHHLRRHVMADYLTRGKLRIDWMMGEAHFRQCLLDHDPAINRGNWLWLSASDFSTAQFVRHYGYDTYVQRHSYGEVRGHA